MSEIFGKRLKVARNAKGLTQKELSDRIRVEIGTLSGWERDYREPNNFEIVISIADILGVTTDWLLGRTGHQKENIFVGEGPHPYSIYKKLPILGTIRAGIPILAEDNWAGEIEVPADLKADFALRVTGDSMSWAGIHEGDTAILRQGNSVSHGMIVAAGMEDATWEATLKFFVEDNGKKLLRAGNPSYEDIIIGPKHRIIGHVVSIQKEPPTLRTYTSMLIPKEVSDKQWQDVIEKAVGSGLDGENVKKMIELFARMVKQV